MILKHVAIDMDDVILDFVGGLRAAIKKEFDVDINPNDISQFELGPFLNPIVGESWWEWLRRRDWLWPNFPAVDGAIGTIERLRREGYYLEIVTSKPEWADYAVWKWLGKWRPAVQRVTIVRSGDVKAHFTDAPMLIDDKMQNIIEWGPNHKRPALLYTRPHNSLEVINNIYITRVMGWHDVYREVKQFYE